MEEILKTIFGSIGCSLATLMSYKTNGDIIWAILHGFCSWLYIIYWIIFKS